MGGPLGGGKTGRFLDLAGKLAKCTDAFFEFSILVFCTANTLLIV